VLKDNVIPLMGRGLQSILQIDKKLRKIQTRRKNIKRMLISFFTHHGLPESAKMMRMETGLKKARGVPSDILLDVMREYKKHHPEKKAKGLQNNVCPIGYNSSEDEDFEMDEDSFEEEFNVKNNQRNNGEMVVG